MILPDKVILLVEFLPAQDLFFLMFRQKEYKIIARDDVGNLVGIAPDKQVFYLETNDEIQPKNIRYIAYDVHVFLQELQMYQKYSEEYILEENPSDEELEKYINEFKEYIAALDTSAFCSEESFWSVIVEQMEIRQLLVTIT